ncbi:MAG: 1-acyl-sn-glycerol-3-phosphate acyltransferase, partial [Tropicimonas sp.]
VGSAILYAQLEQDCIPAATNVGMFWPRAGVLRKPGLAVVEFLPAIPPGRAQADVLRELEEVVETASERLMAEAGHRPASRNSP